MIKAEPDREIIALIAYLQRLGTDIKVAPPAPAPVPTPTQTAPTSPRTAQLNPSSTPKD
jgi:hypothetical protein